MSFRKYLDHEITETVFRNNRDFYDDVLDRKFNVRSSFENRNGKRSERKWCPMQVVGFIAFGKIMNEEMIFNLLTEWAPNLRAQFWWFVLHRRMF